MPFHQKIKPDFESERNREKIEDKLHFLLRQTFQV